METANNQNTIKINQMDPEWKVSDSVKDIEWKVLDSVKDMVETITKTLTIHQTNTEELENMDWRLKVLFGTQKTYDDKLYVLFWRTQVANKRESVESNLKNLAVQIDEVAGQFDFCAKGTWDEFITLMKMKKLDTDGLLLSRRMPRFQDIEFELEDAKRIIEKCDKIQACSEYAINYADELKRRLLANTDHVTERRHLLELANKDPGSGSAE